jgi:hypothetical protein
MKPLRRRFLPLLIVIPGIPVLWLYGDLLLYTCILAEEIVSRAFARDFVFYAPAAFSQWGRFFLYLAGPILLFANAWCLGDWIRLGAVKRSGGGFADMPRLAVGTVVFAVSVFAAGTLWGIHGPWFQVACLLPLLSRLAAARGGLFAAVRGKSPFADAPVSARFALAAASLALMTFAATDPIDYDVLEYHLGAPREYFDAGRIAFLPHNVYANLPSLSSMLNLVLVSFRAGSHAKMLQVFFLFAAAFALISRERGAAGAFAAVFLLSAPESILSAFTARNESMIAWLVLSAFLVLDRSRGKAAAAIAGLLAGGAVAVKVSSAVLVLPLFLGWILLDGKGTNRAARAVWFFGAAFAAAAPWMIRNARASGNPFYPFFADLAERFAVLRDRPSAAFLSAHAPASFHPAEIGRSLHSLFGQFDSTRLWPVLLLLSLFCFELKRVRVLFSMILGGTLAWLFLTHRVERFMNPFLPLEALLLASLLNAPGTWVRKTVRWGLVFQLLFNACFAVYYLFATPVAALYTGQEKRETFWARYDPAWALVDEYFESAGGDPGKVLYVGEARTFRRSWPVVFNTPFVRPVFARYFRDGRLFVDRLVRDGIDYVYVNVSELVRVRKKYPDRIGLSNAAIVGEFERRCVRVAAGPKGLDRLYRVRAEKPASSGSAGENDLNKKNAGRGAGGGGHQEEQYAAGDTAPEAFMERGAENPELHGKKDSRDGQDGDSRRDRNQHEVLEQVEEDRGPEKKDPGITGGLHVADQRGAQGEETA